MLKKLAILTTAAALILSSNAFAGATKAHADKAISQASMANAAAKKLGYEWRDTGKLIKKAKKMVSKKDYSAAIKTAKKAETQGHTAVAQYYSETKRFSKNHN